MCGRYTLTKIDPATLRARFGFDVDPTLDFDERPRFNIAPTDPVLAIRTANGGDRELGGLRWGVAGGRGTACGERRRGGGALLGWGGWGAARDGRGAAPVHSCAIVTCEPNELVR